MYFTTRCPACGTLFRVVNDQLKLSEGWVRCGDCSHVFDAMPQLQLEGMARTLGSAPLPAGKTPTPAVRSASVSTPPAWAAPSTNSKRIVRGQDQAVVAANMHQQPDEQPHVEPGFVRQARRRAFWRTPGVRATLLLLSLLLTMLLTLQWTVHHRDRLAASEPALAPWLSKTCETLGCELSPVRRLEAIVIDSTALVHRLDQFYAFDIVLKNTASIALAVPAVELTLTRMDDTVMARRVFLPHELPGLPGTLPANGSIAFSLRLSLALGEGPAMVGYRALVFYP